MKTIISLFFLFSTVFTYGQAGFEYSSLFSSDQDIGIVIEPAPNKYILGCYYKNAADYNNIRLIELDEDGQLVQEEEIVTANSSLYISNIYKIDDFYHIIGFETDENNSGEKIWTAKLSLDLELLEESYFELVGVTTIYTMESRLRENRYIDFAGTVDFHPFGGIFHARHFGYIGWRLSNVWPALRRRKWCDRMLCTKGRSQWGIDEYDGHSFS